VLICTIDSINSYFVISYSRAKIYFMAVCPCEISNLPSS